MTSSSAPPSAPPSVPPTAVAALLVLLASVLVSALFPHATPRTLLVELASDQFAWHSSTTPIPISTVSVHAKALLSRSLHSDTLPLQPLRDLANRQRLVRVRAFCDASPSACDVNQVDPRFGLTPLHLAALSGDVPLSDWLRARGAISMPDHVARMPANLSFTNFISNSKRWKPAGDDCDFPVVQFPVSHHPAHVDHPTEALLNARREVARLVSEGEPVLMRRALPEFVDTDWDVNQWVSKYAHVPVTVGAVPYAQAFNLSTTRMSLAEYFRRFVAHPNTEASQTYVFDKHPDVCKNGYNALARLVKDAFPTDLVEHPDHTGGIRGIHFFFGAASSGAPFHVHADAINAAVNGRKKWYVYTPERTLYSRKTVKRWVDHDLPHIPEKDRPLECIQRPGDVVYVPLDWGHAVLNLDHHTFGFALELLNRRDTLSHLWP